MAYDSQNIFARILRGEIPCKKVFENEHVLVFHDVFPKAPLHLLLIPKGAYIDSLDFLRRASPEEIVSFWKSVDILVSKYPLLEKGYRLITNNGVNAGQEVPHFHVHLLGGHMLGPMVVQQEE